MDAEKQTRRRGRAKFVLIWLLVPPLLLAAAVLLLTGGLMSRDCRIARVVLGGDLPDTMPVTLVARHSVGLVAESQGDSAGEKVLWRGTLRYGPILIPFAIPGDGHFQARIEDPAGAARVEEFGYVAPSGATHYIFIGRDEIIHSEAHFSALRDPTGNISGIRKLFVGGYHYFADVLSCLGE